MRVYMSSVLLNPFDPAHSPLLNAKPDGPATEPLRLRDPIINALLLDEPGADGVEKLNRFNLALRCMEDTPNLQSEDVTLIKRLVARSYSALIVGVVSGALEAHASL